VDKLIVALNHPEPETPSRAAWILGRRREVQAVGPLIELLRRTQDVYTASEAVRALSRIGTPEAMAFLRTLTEHPAGMVRQAVAEALAGTNCTGAKEEER
jgi:HEAT repeat protein